MNKNLNKKRAVIYCRVSTKEQVDDGNSLVVQEKNCKDYVYKNNYDVAQVFVEKGESAKTADRTELQKMLVYCSDKKNLVSAVVIYKIDRLSRNTDDYSQLRLLLKKYGVDIKSTTEHFENNPAGRFFENTMANIAQFDNDVRAERCSGGMREAVREGRYVWMAPVGYKNTKVLGKATITKSDSAESVLKVFQLLSKGVYSVEEVHRIINKDGLVLRNGKPIAKTYFHQFIRNKLYCGIVEKFGETHKGKFEPIVSEELFNEVQRNLKNNGHRTTQYKTNNPDFPLRKFVKNADGKKITGYWSTGRSNKFPYYRFIAKKGSNYNRDKFEKAFKDYMDEYSFSPDLIERLKIKLKQHLKKTTGSDIRDSEKAKERLFEIKQTQSSLIQKNIKGIVSDQILKDQLDMLEVETSELEFSLIEFKDQELNPDELVAFAEEYLKKPSAVWQDSDLETRMKLQWFEFPQGIVFENKIFRTAKIASVYKTKEAFLPPKSVAVDYIGAYWDEIVQELDRWRMTMAIVESLNTGFVL